MTNPVEALKPFAALGGPQDGIMPAFHDMPDDAVIYENSGKCITAGDVRAARIALGSLIDLKGYRGGPWGEEVAHCADCKRPYDDDGFPDLVIPHDIWKQISPTGNEGGLLCPSCICARLHKAGLRCAGFFTSGPLVFDPDHPTQERIDAVAKAINEADPIAAGSAYIMTKRLMRAILGAR